MKKTNLGELVIDIQGHKGTISKDKNSKSGFYLNTPWESELTLLGYCITSTTTKSDGEKTTSMLDFKPIMSLDDLDEFTEYQTTNPMHQLVYLPKGKESTYKETLTNVIPRAQKDKPYLKNKINAQELGLTERINALYVRSDKL